MNGDRHIALCGLGCVMALGSRLSLPRGVPGSVRRQRVRFAQSKHQRPVALMARTSDHIPRAAPSPLTAHAVFARGRWLSSSQLSFRELP